MATAALYGQTETGLPAAPEAQNSDAYEAQPSRRVAIIGDIALRDYPAQTVATVIEEAVTYLPRQGDAVGRIEWGQAFERMLARGYNKLAGWMKEGGNPLGPTFIIYFSDPRTTPVADLELKIGYPASANAKAVDSVRIEQLPAYRAAVAQFMGPFAESGVVWDSLSHWIAAQGYVTAGPVMEVYLRGMRDNTRPEENFAEVRWPVRLASSRTLEEALPARGTR